MTEWADYQSVRSAQVEQRIKAQLDALPELAPALKRAMAHGMLVGGKRIRPLLVYMVGEMLDAELADLDHAAVAVEMIHAFSLIHDDLPAMDDDALRRGQPTCHIVFDEATAILAGDALQSLAIEILAHQALSPKASGKRLEMIKALTRATGYQGLCGGQALDLAATNSAIDEQALARLHRHKTGALIGAAVTLGYLASGRDEPATLAQLTTFADRIGLAFQVQDDILDVTSDTQTLGKPQGSDLENNKSTYPALLGLAGAKALAEDLHQQALQALQALPYNTELLRSFTGYLISRKY